ncbi:MAG: histidine kinase dimerization/phosphoacceptor domain -containing protein [Melioribacteraceae bacterium]
MKEEHIHYTEEELRNNEEYKKREIEQRILFQQELAESEKKYRALFENSTSAILITNSNSEYVEANNAACELLGYSNSELTQLKVKDIFNLAVDRESSSAYQEFYSKGFVKGETTLITKSKNKKFIEYSAVAFFIPGHHLAIINDVTDKILQQEKIKDSLKEKEILLKEINNRVRNNLQMMNSLINLQINGLEDKKSRNILVDIQSRIKSMSLIHEFIYESTNFLSIKCKDYIERLVQYLRRAYLTGSKKIQTNISIDDHNYNMELVIYLGLIINELVSNSYKHAFLKKQTGNITIELKNIEDNYCLLTVKDDGDGIPYKFDVNNISSIGLQLANTLARQLKGKLELESSESGTTFLIHFMKS